MKTLTLNLLRFRPLAVALCCLLIASSSMGQQEAQAGDAPIVLTNQTRTRVINPGRRIKLYGPPGTVAIKGKLVSMGDSISIRPDNNRLASQTRKIAAADVRVVGMRRLGWNILALYFGSQAVLVIALTIVSFVTFPIGIFGIFLGLMVLQVLYMIALTSFALLLAYPRYRVPSWVFQKK